VIVLRRMTWCPRSMLLPPGSGLAFTGLVWLPLRSGAVSSLASGARALRPLLCGPGIFPPGKPHEIDRTTNGATNHIAHSTKVLDAPGRR
jgi:hypothetical protein